jgi:hypothetical protein
LLQTAKQQQREIVEVAGETVTEEEIIQILFTQSLFALPKTIVIENLFSRQKSKIQDALLERIKTYDGEHQLIFWEKKPIGKVLQRRLPPNTQAKEFKIPAIIFKFAESIQPQQKQQALTLLEELLATEAAEYVFVMVVRQVRLMFLLMGEQTIPGAPWMIGKLKKQASQFTTEQLDTLHTWCYQVDKDQKTGRATMPLAWHLRMCILDL